MKPAPLYSLTSLDQDDCFDASFNSPRVAEYETDEEQVQHYSLQQFRNHTEYYMSKTKYYNMQCNPNYAISPELAAFFMSKFTFYNRKFERWRLRFAAKKQQQQFENE